ncbi:MAG: Enolase [Patescibacteria group bacterium]|nr:Enolase [Patescibacteria group bacterium]
MENKITKIMASEVNDSRGNPTLKVTVYIGDISASFSVPSGASTGIHEAHELRDADGKGVKNAIENINTIIANALINQNIFNQAEIDRIMIDLDGTTNKDILGGNSTIGVSIACAKLAAKISNKEVYEYLSTLKEIKSSRNVPYLYMNLINGGKHAKNNLAFQEYHIVPEADSVEEAISMGIKIVHSLEKIIRKNCGDDSVILGDEGGYAPIVNNIREPLLYLNEAIQENNFPSKVHIALDVASSSFYKDGKYYIDGKDISKEELLELYGTLINEFNIFSIEDPFNEEDFASFRKLKDTYSDLFVMGDDLTVTNKHILQKAIDSKCINAMIIKPNQIGTLSETLDTMKLARDNDIELIVSHRSGETDDDFIADLVYAFGCFGLKSGAPEKSERKVKYDRLKLISNMK